MAELTEQYSDAHQDVKKVTLIGAILNAILAILKVIIGLLANSQALITDGIHSASDLISDSIVIVMHRISHQAPDEQHPYGHGRFETMGTVVLGSILLIVAGGIGWESLLKLMIPESQLVPTWPALLVAVLSILSKEWLYQITKTVGERLNSSLVIANAWHHRSDALSSIVVLVGIAGAMLGFTWLDTFAALIVAGMVAKIGWSLLWDSLKELVDTGLSAEENKQIIAVIKSVPGVIGVHDLRTRKMGANVLLDVHLQVKADASVSEGHYIGNWVAQTVVERFDSIHSVLFHIDPENDKENEYAGGCDSLLPLRKEVMSRLIEQWQDALPQQFVEKATLHYLDEKIFVDIFLKSDTPCYSETLASELTAKIDAVWFAGVEIWRR